MAITIEGFTVVVQRERIQHLLDSGELTAPNSTAIADDHLWRCSFMVQEDATAFLESLEEINVNTKQGPDSDAVLINEFDREVEPYCEWLLTSMYDKAVIAWLVGTEPRTVVAREGWDPKVGSGLIYQDRQDRDGLELLRVEDNIEVFRDRKTGREIYIGRSTTPIASLFEAASQIVLANMKTAGEKPVTGNDAKQVASAIEMLDQVIAESSGEWRFHWVKGKAHLALGQIETADQCFRRALDLEKNEQAITRELAGTCLALGKFGEAVELAQQAVSLVPDNHELICNLALAHLLAGNIDAAQASSRAAIKMAPRDAINRHVFQLIEDTASGRRPQPKSMAEAQSPHKRKRFWQFWK